MSSPNNLEITGNLLMHPLAELLVELLQTRLDGSLRLLHHKNKTIIYFRAGEIVFAVSNQRQHRIFELLLQTDAITKEQLVEIPEFTSDFALTRYLQEKKLLSASSVKSVFTRQIEAILIESIGWKDGVWTFSALARIKDDIHFKPDIYGLLIEYARNLTKDKIIPRFKSLKESFSKNPTVPSHIDMLPQEAFVLSRFEKSLMQIDEITALSGLSDSETLKTLYVLWLGGFLSRQYWNVALDAHILSSMSSATYELKKEAAALPVIKPIEQKQNVPEVKQEINQEISEQTDGIQEKAELTLEKYLESVEAAETHYELLNIPYKSSVSEIKMAYFGLAKRFHPDLFHKQTDAVTHRRIQNAFSEIARAYETLRVEETRETYDFKLHKILRELDKLSPEEKAKPKTEQKELSEASDIFEHGFNLLMEEEYEQALPYLSRAVHIAPDVARYRAYYGKILSIDKNQRYKAEAELQAAVKLESDNPGYRIMLSEFFIQYNLPKRAEGELTRLLTIFPDIKEAQALLDSLQNK